MATAPKTVYAHITKDPGACGGRACIDHTRIRVIDIVELEREGFKPDQMRNVFAVPLSLAQIHSALAYADEFRNEIEADFAEEAAAEVDHERQRAEYLKRHGR